MAQTGYTPILIYSSSTVSQAPSASNLTNSTLGSELAINITDGKLFYKDNANAIQVIGWKTVPTTAGGTGLTSYTAGDLVYYATGTALTKLAIGASGRWLGSSGTAPQWNAPAALTKTDDTNVTLTLGGSASTALLNAASLTLGWTGTLAVSRGGTGTGTAFTAGSLIYAGASGVYSQNNANLFWDNTNTFLGIRTNAPGAALQVGGGLSGSVATYPGGIQLNESPVSLQSTGGLEYKTSAFGSGYGWKISSIDSSGVQLVIGTRQNSATWSEIGRFTSTGGFALGTTTDPGATNLSVNGNAYIGNTSQSAASERFNVNGFGGFGDRAATNPFVLIGNTGSGNGVVGTYSNHALEIRTNNTSRATFTTAGGFTCLGIYNTIVGATNRDVFVDNAGVVGYVSSTRESKTNIENLQDIDWLYALNPVTFNYRKRDDDGEYTDEIDGDIQYGMIAEDVEQVRPDLCFYDEIDGEQHLRGIQYSKLIPVMLKAMQQLKTQLDEAKTEIEALKGTK
jgi:hypothetical protein